MYSGKGHPKSHALSSDVSSSQGFYRDPMGKEDWVSNCDGQRPSEVVRELQRVAAVTELHPTGL